MKKTSLKLIASLMLLFIVLIRIGASEEKVNRIDSLFKEWDNKQSPGCALAIIKDGKIIYEKGYGMANLELEVPITPQSVFYVGSVSKQFVAFSIALLVKEGKVSLDDEIQKYLPEIPDYGKPITIRHLIHHTSGLRDYLTLEEIAGIEFGSYHEQDVLELIARQKELNFPPGKEYLYSNSGYFLLGQIIKKVSGKSLRQFTEEKIFKPLNMKNSHFHDDFTMIVKNRASGYFPQAPGGYKNFITTFDCVGSGGLFTTVEDLFLWDQNFYHCQVGGKEVIEMINTRGRLQSGREIDYAFGLVRGEYRGLKTVSHGGALGGYRSMLLRFPEQRFSVIILSNLSSFNPSKLAYLVADIYLADEFNKERAELKAKEEFFKHPPEKLKKFTGFYINKKIGVMHRISIEDSNLYLSLFGEKYALRALSEREFEVEKAPVEVRVKFEDEKGEKPAFMHLSIEGEEEEIYEAFEPLKLSLEKLREYEGEYWSDELEVEFKLKIKDKKLFFTHKNAPRFPLQATVEDRFNLPGMIVVKFIRDEAKKISGFTLDAGRVRNLLFIRKGESQINL